MEQQELAEIYQQYGHLVLRRCTAVLKNETEAQDVLHEVFIRLIRYQRSFERAPSMLGWLYKTADRCCFDRISKKKREVMVLPETLSEVAQQGLPHDAREAREIILAFLGRFDRKVQHVALLYYLDELPQEEIAKRLGWSRRTVGKKINLLRQRARTLAQSFAQAEGGPS